MRSRRYVMRKGNTESLVRLILVAAVMLVSSAARAQEALSAGESEPVAGILNPDGTLNLDTGFAGSLNVAGYRMVTGSNGEPRFVPEGDAKAVTKIASPESDPSDVYWDDQFALPGTDGSVRAVAADGSGNVYIGGDFTAVGAVPANRIARWNGTTWSTLGTGMNNRVFALAVSGSDVYAGGEFTTPGAHIARWNGTAWSALGSGINGAVYALAAGGSDVYAGGNFTTAGAVSANNVARWNGTAWSTLGTGMSSWVYALAVSGSDVYAGGGFMTAGGVSVSRIATWNGTAWSALGSGMDDTVRALAVSGNDVYAGGGFTTAGGVGANSIAKWNGSTWSPLGTGMDDWVLALAASGSDIYSAGYFTTAGGTSANRIAKWNGTTWSALGTGMDSFVRALAVTGDALFAGGNFTTAGGKASAYFAEWQPRVNTNTLSLTGDPGDATLGDDAYGFYKPALVTDTGTTVSYAGGLPVDATMRRAAEIQVNGSRVNGAFTLSPEGVTFGGTGATLRVEFSEDDATAYVVDYTDFRAVKLVYPINYPANMEAVGVELLSTNTAVPVRLENGRQIYAITIPFSEIGSTYGAVPESEVLATPTPTEVQTPTLTPTLSAGLWSERWKVYR